ncbi:hypothetical protein ILYODFUR_031864 [Ilyodon furcidens]|uniref:Uncharacterized protein n=1 Tax=Ilyodon furcidens TaxID=33524 RepID=A0ABV0UM93_9TELE
MNTVTAIFFHSTGKSDKPINTVADFKIPTFLSLFLSFCHHLIRDPLHGLKPSLIFVETQNQLLISQRIVCLIRGTGLHISKGDRSTHCWAQVAHYEHSETLVKVQRSIYAKMADQCRPVNESH